MAVNINVPSQVKTYANLAAFPATGALKTIYIAEDTNKTYRWTGSVYVEVSASASGITIGSTAIASGVVGRVLFEGAGNVVQESSSLFWDATNNRLGIGTSSPASTFEVVAGSDANGIKLRGRSADNISNFFFSSNDGLSQYGYFQHRSSVMRVVNNVGDLEFWNGPNIGSTVQRATLFGATGNLAINTTTDAGFRLDVNGTARVQGQLTTTGRVAINGTTLIANAAMQVNGTNQFVNYNTSFSNGSFYTYQAFGAWDAIGSDAATGAILAFGGYRASQWTGITFHSSGSERLRIFSTGNVGINTTTDAGFRLDVNGSGRFNNEFILNRSDGVEMFRMNNSPAVLTFNGNNSSTPTLRFHSQSNILFYLKASENRIGINTTTPNASAIMDVTSTTQGFLPPRMTTTQKNAIASPAAGLMVYDTTLNVISYYNGSMWI